MIRWLYAAAAVATVTIAVSANPVEREIRSVGPAQQMFQAGKIPILQFDEFVDTTMKYDDSATMSHFYTLPNRVGDDSLNVRFDSPFETFGFVGALVSLFNMSGQNMGPMGHPDMRVTFAWSGLRDDGDAGYPVQSVVSVDVPNAAINFSVARRPVYNFVDFSQLRHPIENNPDTSFHIIITSPPRDDTAAVHDTLCLSYDDANHPTSRSGLYDGRREVWEKLINLAGIRRGYNFAIRAVVSNGPVQYVVDPDGHLTPLSFVLGSAYPNPFNSTARINFSVPPGVPYNLAVFDAAGRERLEFPTGQGKGTGFLTLDGRDLTAGVYFLRLTTPTGSKVQSITYLK